MKSSFLNLSLISAGRPLYKRREAFHPFIHLQESEEVVAEEFGEGEGEEDGGTDSEG